ncbi:MAG: hypothetical protein BIFFINMI_02183 [Phycisphaerae bacterium]|nr:hypothetical protein [Phycisphaerae bacterium]
MTHRQRILNVLNGRGGDNDRPPYFPDLSYWHEVRTQSGTMPAGLAGLSLLELHRRLDCGLPVHLYTDTLYTTAYEGVEVTVRSGELAQTHTIRTPVGTLTGRRDRPHRHESWFWREHLVKTHADLAAIEYMVSHRTLTPTPAKVQGVLDELGGCGFVDLVLPRSPMPRLLIDWAGIETGLLLMHDDPGRCQAFFDCVAEADDAAFELIAKLPGSVCIFGDNVDEVIVSPPMYRRWSLPYYRRRSAQLHAAGKLVACHMDGRLRGLLPMVADTGLDILDGLTPAPMNDWQLDDALRAMAPSQRLWCGVPCSLFCDGTAGAEQIRAFGRRILDTFGPRVVLNVGDQVPPNADIDLVAALGEVVR